MAEQKKLGDEAAAPKKNLQVKVDPDYALQVAALAQAMGFTTVSDLIKKLLDDALANAQTKFDELKREVEERYAKKAQAEIEILQNLAAAVVGNPASDTQGALGSS